ncbi:hypothetical protein QMK19_33525, partial [Streptomyces sp. H10-C2]|nr:hypothetical protein [Streptomyces sp. PH10-H1]MDJ0374414.1 hypothetical protein [Streptomyces sp. H10-C2]
QDTPRYVWPAGIPGGPHTRPEPLPVSATFTAERVNKTHKGRPPTPGAGPGRVPDPRHLHQNPPPTPSTTARQTHSSWANQVERWFAELQRRCLARGSFRSLDELTCALDQWITFWNANAKPFKWTRTADQIIDAIGRYCARLGEPHHQGGMVARP